MPKTKISEFSATPGNNTDIDGINIAEGCAPSGINDAIRELMAQLKDFQAGTAGDSFNGPVGTSTAAAGAFTTLSSTGNTTLGDASGDAVTINGATTFVNVSPTITPGTANGVAYLNGSKVLTTGSALTFDGSRIALGTATSNIQLTTTVNTNQAYISLADADGRTAVFRGPNSGAPNCTQIGSVTNHDVAFLYGNAEQMRLTSTGLGIGTSSPGAKLDIRATNPTQTIKASTAGFAYHYISNDGGDFYVGRDSSAGAAFGNANANVLWGVGANPILFATNNTVRATLDSSGNLGLGVTPSAWNSDYRTMQFGATGLLYGRSGGEVAFGTNWYRDSGGTFRYLTTAAATYQAQASGIHYWFTAPSGTAGNTISFTQAMTLDSSGRLLVGVTSASGNAGFQLKGASSGYVRLEGTSSTLFAGDASQLISGAAAQDSAVRAEAALLFAVGGGTERARITSGGDLLVGTTTSSARTTIQSPSGTGTIYAYQTTTSTGEFLFAGASDLTSTNSVKVKIYTNGNIQNTNNSYGALSDIKLKENIADATPKLAGLMQVKVRNYNLIGDTTKQIGVIAQELEQVFPSMVEETPDRDADGNDLGTATKGVKYSVFVPMLIKAMQEQQAIIEQLKARLDAANL